MAKSFNGAVALVLSLSLGTGCALPPPSTDRRFPAGTGPGAIVVADLDGDGRVDLAVANEQSGDVSVLLGDGQGGFSAAPGSPFPVGHIPNDVTAGDFNRDGHLDLAFADHETQHLPVLLGDGSGRFAPATGSPVTVAVRPHPHGVATGDFDGDGKLDLVTDSWGEDRLQLVFGDGKGGFRTPGTYVGVGKHPYQRIRVADLNRDSKADIVCTNLEGDDVTILLGDGQGGFRQPPGSPFPCGDSPFNIAIGDVTADGKADLAIVNSPGSTADRSGRNGMTVLIGDGSGRFTRMEGSPFVTREVPNLIAIGDVNGDGVGDVVVSNPDADSVTLFTMGRRASVKSNTTVPIPGRPKGVALVDVDNDGRADIVVTNHAQGRVTVRLSK